MSLRNREPAHGSGGADPIGPARALLPVRLFFGATFLYAGIDKLLDPRFFDPASAASIQAQMLAFTRDSPLAPLVRLGEPFAIPIGFAIALLEIAIGLGALTGLAFQVAAVAGAFLSVLFFLTASWATRPYYFGADLPYAVGWLSLAIAGHGGLIVSRRLLDWAGGGIAVAAASGEGRREALWPAWRSEPRPGDAVSLTLRGRRTVLEAWVLGALAVVVASLAVPFRRAGAGRQVDETGADAASSRPADGSPSGSGAGTPLPAGASAAPLTVAVARVSDLVATGARSFVVPFSAPAPLPAGDPAVIVELADGSFVAFDAVCTHAGCTVQWDRADRLLYCPCHGATFDPADHARVVGEGPTNQPLASIPIVVDLATGMIALQA